VQVKRSFEEGLFLLSFFKSSGDIPRRHFSKRYILMAQPNTDIYLTINGLLIMALLIRKYEEWGYTAENNNDAAWQKTKKLAFASFRSIF